MKKGAKKADVDAFSTAWRRLVLPGGAWWLGLHAIAPVLELALAVVVGESEEGVRVLTETGVEVQGV